MLTPTQLKQLCERLRLRPSKTRGQNFLIKTHPIQKMIIAAHLDEVDTVIEIGAGFGILTDALQKSGKHVVAIEIEPAFVAYLREQFAQSGNVEIVEGDALKKVPEVVAKLKSYALVGNIPYSITGALLETALAVDSAPRSIVFLVQKEIGEKMRATPPAMNMLAVAVQYYASPHVIAKVPKGNFWPMPLVDSVIIALYPHSARPSPQERQLFFRVAKAGFAHPRKMLVNNLKEGLGLPRERIEKILAAATLSLKARPGELSVEDWRALCDSAAGQGSGTT